MVLVALAGPAGQVGSAHSRAMTVAYCALNSNPLVSLAPELFTRKANVVGGSS